jgi:hypothetical protein
MGNKVSVVVDKQDESVGDQETVKTRCSTLDTVSSDDKLRELVEATATGEASVDCSECKVSLRSSIAASVDKLGHALGNFFSLAPLEPQQPSLPRIKVLLHGCQTEDEHRDYLTTFLGQVKDLHGQEGLRAAGFEYRMVRCRQHQPPRVETLVPTKSGQEEEKKSDSQDREPQKEEDVTDEVMQLPVARAAVMSGVSPADNATNSPCFQCSTRLFHVESDSLITEINLQQLVADGNMYEEVTRLCQECAQEAMQREGKLEWVTICNDPAHSQPVRALVHEDHPLVSESTSTTADDNPTLLIATGKGKVKAGIFSRRHLLTSGMEASTALPMVSEAARRNMSCVILDPNARGDRLGMDTFEKSFEVVLGHLDHTTRDECAPHVPSSRALYIVAHSASGSQLVRYMLDRVHGYLPYLRAIAFTDSTHNIQWTRNNQELQSLLGSPRCVYFRSASKNHDELWHTRKAGDAVEADSHWEHRFGKTKTLWAGTEEHSLMNWFAHNHIWDHFDQQMHPDESHTDPNDKETNES